MVPNTKLEYKLPSVVKDKMVHKLLVPKVSSIDNFYCTLKKIFILL